MRKFLIGLILLCATTIAHAGDLPTPIYPVEVTESKEFTLEYVYRYYLQKYKQPLQLNYVNKEDMNFTSPENALVALVSAITAANIQAFLESWDTISRAELAANFVNPESAEAIRQEWKNLYENSKLFLLSRIDRKGFVILEYVIKKENHEDLVERINIAEEDGKWKATNKFSKDVISNYATAGTSKIRLPGE